MGIDEALASGAQPGTAAVADVADVAAPVETAPVNAAPVGAALDHDPAAVRRSRLAVALIFFLHGATAGTYSGRLPWMQTHFHASPAELGAVMTAQGVGALLAAPATGVVSRRLGARGGMRLLILCWTGSLALPALMPNLGVLSVVLFGFGAAAGCSDVAMNAHAVRVERRAGKSIMSGLHGIWAVGMIVGSACGGLCAFLHIGASAELPVTAAVLFLAALPACSLLPADGPAAAGDEAPTRYALPTRAVLIVGIVAFCAVFAEGSSDGWCAVYLTRVVHASQALGAYCLTFFSLAMAIGRLTGDATVRRFGPVAVVRCGGVLATAGGCLVVFAHTAVLGFAGFSLLGIGIATSVPLAIAAAGRTRGDADAAVAGMTTLVYAGSLLAAPVIGLLGSAVSLSFAFGAVALCTLGILFGARALR